MVGVHPPKELVFSAFLGVCEFRNIVNHLTRLLLNVLPCSIKIFMAILDLTSDLIRLEGELFQMVLDSFREVRFSDCIWIPSSSSVCLHSINTMKYTIIY